MREPECGAIPPNVGGPIPCHLEPGHDGEHFSTSGCAGSEIRWTDSTPTERDDVAAVLAAHVWRPGSPRDGNPGCYCGWRCPVAKGVSRHDLHATHVSEQLAPLIAAREQAARAEAEADRDHWKAHAKEAGNYKRTRSFEQASMGGKR